LSHGSENWTIIARDTRSITAAEMKYMRKKKQGTLGQIIKQIAEIAMETSITQVLDKIHDYRRKWLQYIHRMPRNRLPGQ